MRKILIILFALLTANLCFAADDLSFIYINGSNNNDAKMKNWYENGVKELHPVMCKKFLRNRQIRKYFAQFGGINIKEEPIIFFWGYNSKDDLDFVKKQLEISKMVSSSGAYLVRNLITEFLHDAIWVQKPHNMLPILEDLNNQVKAEAQAGNKVMLYGYSAGTFVTYEYMFNKLRYINLQDLFKTLNVDDDMTAFVNSNPRKNTCVSAISYYNGGLGTMSYSGHLVLNKDMEWLKSNYLNLDKITELVCAPEDKVAGVINFASPLVLFYSDMSDENYELNYYNKLMIKYIFENGLFFMTVNFKEDPLGFPMSRNMTVSEVEQKLNMKIENPAGVIYDDSGVWSKRIFPLAHTSYWTARGTFAKAVTKSMVNGYKFQYNEKYQQKVIKKNSKKSEL